LIRLEGFRFRRGDTVVHRADPRAKFILAASFMALSLLFMEPQVLTPILVAQVAIFALGRSLRPWLRSLRGLAPFAVLVFAAQFLVGWSMEGAATWGVVYVSAAYAYRFIVIVGAMSWFFLTTSPDDLGAAMEQTGLPLEVSFAFTMAVRFVPVIADEFQAVYDAQRSRGLELERGGLALRIRRYIPIIIPVFVETIRRTYEVADAMEVRAFGAKPRRTRLNPLTMKRTDWCITALSMLITALGAYLYLNRPPFLINP